MQRRWAESVESGAQAAADEVARAEAEISDTFVALARDIGEINSRASATVTELIHVAEEWLNSDRHSPPSSAELVRLGELRDQLAQVASTLESSAACDDGSANPVSVTSLRSGEPLPPRSGRDYDYFADLRQILDSWKTGSNGSSPA